MTTPCKLALRFLTVAALALHTAAAPAQHSSIIESFSYPEGSSLVNQTGGNNMSGIWTGGWTGSESSNSGAFTTTLGRITVGGDQTAEISRGFDLQLGQPGNPAPGQTMHFSAELTEVAPLGDHQVSLAFADSVGPTAQFGISRSGSVGQFYIKLGDNGFNPSASGSGFVGSATVPALPAVLANTPYTLAGRLEFNVPGLSDGKQERLTLWINRQFSGPAGDAAPSLQTTFDLGEGRISLGNQLTLRASTSPGDPILIDDLRMGHYLVHANGTRIDIGRTSQTVQDGYIAWNADASFTKTISAAEHGWGPDDLVLTLAGINRTLTAADIISASVTEGVADALRNDAAELAGGLKLTLHGLTNDPFPVKAYLHLLDMPGGSKVKVMLNDPFNGTELATVSQTGQGDTLAAEATVMFMADGVSDYTLYYVPVDANGDYLATGVVALSGVEVVPEPSTFALLGMGLVAAAFALRRRLAR